MGKNHYLDNLKFETQLCLLQDAAQKIKKYKLHKGRKEYKELKQEYKKAYDEVMQMFYKLAENVINYCDRDRKSPVDRDDAIQNMWLTLSRKWERWDRNKEINGKKCRAFSFFTQVAVNEFRQKLRVETQYRKFKTRLMDEAINSSGITPENYERER